MEIRDTRNGKWHWVNNAVIACSHITHAEKSVYSALATFSGCSEIHPNFKTIAERSNTSERHVKSAIKKLIEVGYITVDKGGGRGNANVYNLLKASKGCKFCTVYKGCKEKQKRVQKDAKKGANFSPQLDKEIDKEIDKDDLFDQFWKEYPKKVGKVVAQRSFNKLKVSDSLLKEILNGLRAYKETEQWQKDRGQYIPNPATFLNQRRWEDSLEEDGGEVIIPDYAKDYNYKN